jgi:hypothetical protein
MAGKRKYMPFDQHLHTLVLRNQAVTEEPGDKPGQLTLVVPLNYDKPGLKPLAKILKAREEKRFILEGTGLDVYNMLEGKKTFEELIDQFSVKYRLTFFESRAFLMDYIRTLVERGIAIIGVTETQVRD